MMSFVGEAIVARAGHCFDQSVRAEQSEPTRDSTGHVAALPGIGRDLRLESAAAVAVLESLEGEFSVKDRAEEWGFVGTDWMQRAIGAAAAGDPVTDGIEQAVRRGRVAHHAERVQIARGGATCRETAGDRTR